MVSRNELDSILKVQADAFQMNIKNVIAMFESRLLKVENELSASKHTISILQKTNEEQKILIQTIQAELSNNSNPEASSP